MIFEGSEKKAEIIIDPNKVDLFALEDSFWQDLVAQACATILSHTKNDDVRSYLLSESSLFVWKDRILLITCGQTTLINAINFFKDKIGTSNIEQLIFQRKNEYYSHMQPTNFFDDIKNLQKNFCGRAYRMGAMDGHHNFVYHLNKSYTPKKDDHTYEFLIYDISKSASNLLTKAGLTIDEIRHFLGLNDILQDFSIDDYLFEPFGYSMNAISKDNYFTIHITPQEQGSYISFETDINLPDYIDHFLNVFSPGSFDFIEFCPDTTKNTLELKTDSYLQKSMVEQKLECGYTVGFSHYNKKTITKTNGYQIL